VNLIDGQERDKLLQHSVREEGEADEEFVMTFHLHKEVI
jgi:hypothetical protein